NASNNINGVNGDSNGDGEGHEVHTLPSDPYYSPPVSQAVTDAQEAYVAHCIDELNDLDNIFWEISNESHQYSDNWHYHMIDFIHSYEASQPDYKRHLVWISAYDLDNSTLFADECHAEIASPNRFGPNYRDPPAWSENKVVILDTDHLWGWGGDRDFVWKAFTRGYHPIYMDPLQDLDWPPEDPRSIRVRVALGDTLSYAERMNLKDVTPQNALSSTSYCLADPGMEYLVLQLNSGASFTVNLLAGSYDYEWFNTNTSLIVQTGNFTWAGGNKSFTPPFITGYAVLYLVEIVGPIALINANPSNGPSPLTVNFDGSASYDKSGGNIVSYEWDFYNDGTKTGSGQNTSHVYRSSITLTVTVALTVTDNDGYSDTETVVITIHQGQVSDFDGDGDVDQEDFGHFQACMSGMGAPQDDHQCQDARLDADGDVDPNDFTIFQNCMNGANQPPKC
ncbi:MAG: PKD domain-containing protein, partial [Planctomycetota bacterium]